MAQGVHRLVNLPHESGGPAALPPRDRLHVGLFTDSYGPGYNGVTIAVRQLEAGLTASGHAVSLIAPAGSQDQEQTPGEYGFRTFLPSMRLPGVHPAVAFGWGFSECLRRLMVADLDVVHVHGFGPVSFLGVHLAARRKIPLVITWHTDIRSYLDHYKCFQPLISGFVYTVLVLLERRPCLNSEELGLKHSPRLNPRLWRGVRSLLEQADAVTVPSDKVRLDLQDFDIATGIFTIPSGVDRLTARAEGSALTRETKGQNEAPRLLYVGRVAPEKGIGLLLDAFHLVREALPKATLTLVGDYACARGLKRRLKQLGIDAGVILVGEVERQNLGVFYESADVFVFPSTTDTQGLVLHEAAHAGLPIVSVDSYLTAVVARGENALICEPTAESLSEHILEMLLLCENEQFVSAASAVGKELAGEYTSARQAADLESLYSKLLQLPRE